MDNGGELLDMWSWNRACIYMDKLLDEGMKIVKFPVNFEILPYVYDWFPN